VIFIDTSAWYSASSSRDANHSTAKEFFAALQEPFVTTDFVVDETLTLFRMRGENRHALEFGAAVIDARFAEIVEVESQDFCRAWQMFRDYHDKKWSFTDCTSFVVMERMGITRAFAFDDHFRQLGKVTVVP
jgi:predicted nucleic acid-binding protein